MTVLRMNAAAYKARWEARKRASQSEITYNPEWIPEGRKQERWRWLENASNGLRVFGKVHEIRSNGTDNLPYIDHRMIDHNGWYTDGFQSDTVCGVVLQLPGKGGKPRFIPAIEDPNNEDCYIADFHSVTDDLIAVIRWADKMAKGYAEDEREYQAKYQAEERIAEIAEEIKTEKACVSEIRKELKANAAALKDAKILRAAIRTAIAKHQSKIARLKAERKKLQDDFWSIEPGY